MTFKNFSSRQAKFWRAYCGVTTLSRRLSVARQHVLESVPPLAILRENSTIWESASKFATKMTSIAGSDVLQFYL